MEYLELRVNLLYLYVMPHITRTTNNLSSIFANGHDANSQDYFGRRPVREV